VLTQHFQRYENQELMLKNAKWIYINYNRKPRQHRVQFVKQLLQHKLNDYGIVTLGKPNVIYDKDPNNYLYLTIGEKAEDYAKDNHWFTGPDEFGIPHDVLTLHNMHYWQQHFLNIIGATEFNHWDDIFVSETQFKPIIGLRPFVINGNQRTYQWLRDHGFRTFNQYWEHIPIETGDVHDTLITLIEYLKTQDLVAMFNNMLPDLLYNQNRFVEFAQEQKHKMENVF